MGFQTAFAQTGAQQKAEMPFFTINGRLAKDIPLVSVKADVQISGVIAHVTLTQEFYNDYAETISAEYVFPGSTSSAVHAMKMFVGEREIEAEIREKQQAKMEYEAAKSEGKKASLLEQHRPNVFQMSVANIDSGETIKVSLSYTELLVPEDGTYQFVLPTAVGERFVKGEDAAEDEWAVNPFALNQTAKDAIGSNPFFDINVKLNTGVTLQEVKSPSHPLDIKYESKKSVAIRLKDDQAVKAGKDFVLDYKLKGSSIETGLLTYEENGEKYFLYMAQPPARVALEETTPREYIFIVDVSGSMNGFPIGVSKELMRELFAKLQPTDRFNVLLFASASAVFAEQSIPASADNLKKAFAFIDKQGGAGGTQLINALNSALDLPETPDYARSLVIVTDGYVSVEREAYDLIRQKLGNANFFPFGIGSGVNRYIIEGMANAGNSTPFVILSERDAAENAAKFRQYIEAPLLTDIDVDFGKMQAYDVEPAKMATLFAEKPVIMIGKYKGDLNGEVDLSGTTVKGDFASSVNMKDAVSGKDNEALKYLWARTRIRNLSDYYNLDKNGEAKREITALGLKYSLLTEFTSFVAIDNVKQDKLVKKKSINNQNGSVPEPHEWTIIILSAAIVSYFLFMKNRA